MTFKRDLQELNTASTPTAFVLETGPHFYPKGFGAGDQIHLSTFRKTLTAVLRALFPNADVNRSKMIFFGTVSSHVHHTMHAHERTDTQTNTYTHTVSESSIIAKE